MKETELMNGTIDVIWNGYSKTSERMKKVAFSNSYLANDQVLVTKEKNVKNGADMKDKTIGVQSGSSGYDCYVGYPDLLKSMLAKRFNMIRSTMLFWILMPREFRES